MRPEALRRLFGGVCLVVLLPVSGLANPLLCSPSMLVGRLTSGATNPSAVVGLCGCTDTVVAAIRSLRMPLPGACAADPDAGAASRGAQPGNAPRSQQQQRYAPRPVASTVPAAPAPTAPPPAATRPSLVCCELSVSRDGVELLRQRVCDGRCTARGVPEVLFAP